MNSRKQWLMDQQTYQKFKQYRQQMYPLSLANVNHDAITQYYINSLIVFLAKRRQSKENPFAVQKLICTAVTLFKRFYLVNQFKSTQHPGQHALCCIYLCLKLNQYSSEDIKRYASKWCTKSEPSGLFKPRHLHYHQEGYSEKQLNFLTKIGFQLARSPMIQPVQSLYHQIVQNIGQLDNDLWSKLINRIVNLLQIIYYDQKIIFLYPGPLLAIAAVYGALKIWIVTEKRRQQDIPILLGKDVCRIFEKNSEKIEQLSDYLLNSKKFNPTPYEQEQLKKDKALINMTRPIIYETPPSKSPKMSPKSPKLF